MTWAFTKILDHGTQNPIVARLSLQVMQILDQCEITKTKRDDVAEIYLESLLKKLIRCWEIQERYRLEFNKQVESYKPPSQPNQGFSLPFITNLEQECHNFLYEYKNFVRDLIKVFNMLYGTDFEEASEFFEPNKRKKRQSLIQYAEVNFGISHPKTDFLKEAETNLQGFIYMRNAVEHPEGYSGVLKISNFVLGPDKKVDEPCWWREKDGKIETQKSPMRHDLDVAIHDLMTLAEDVLVSWADENLKAKDMMRIVSIPEERRDPKCPIKYVVTLSEALEKKLVEMERPKR